jgi:hypothetical protein
MILEVLGPARLSEPDPEVEVDSLEEEEELEMESCVSIR